MTRAISAYMVARQYQDLDVWRLARELERMVLASITTSPASGDVDFCRQIRRSVSSAPRNIAEGFGRFLPGDFAKFVRNARGSLMETQDHLDAALERGYLSREQQQEMQPVLRRALGASARLVVYLDNEAIRWKKKGLRGPTRRSEP